MISPGRILCILAAVPLVATVLLYFEPEAWPFVLGLDAVVVILALGDLLTLPWRKQFRVRREFAHIATRGDKHAFTIVLENRSRRTFDVLVRDDQPPGLAEEGKPLAARLPAQSRNRIHYTLVPTQRGSFTLEWVWIQMQSRLGLWTKTLRLPANDSLRVFPALKQISRYALYARLNRMSLLGVRKSRRIQSDNEFERLRDYSPDDQYRSIDWRATSRRLKLTVRDFQSNQSQRVVFLIDCGRMMVNEHAGQSLLDGAFDAALTLAYIALSQHDEAGLLCFSDRILRWIPPGGGKQQLNRMVHAVHDVQPEWVESRYDQAFLHLQAHCRKRTLAILITNVIDDRNADQLKAHMINMVGKHLPLAVLLRDRELFQQVEGLGPVQADDSVANAPGTAAPTDREMFQAGAAADILCWRHQVLTDLRHAGVLTMDTYPQSLTAPLVNEYLRIKSQHLL